MNVFRLFVLIVSSVFAVFVTASETTNNSLVSGSFGVAWLDDGGSVRLYDGTKIVDPVPGVKVYALLAADLLEEGADQLVYLDDARKALHVHSFKTEKTLGPFGHNVRTMALGRCSADETFPSLLAGTFSGSAYRWTKDVMDGGWIPVSGEFSQASGGRFDRRSNLDDFVVVSAGNVYVYSSKWQTYSKVVEGNDIVSVLAGNFTASPGDEIAMIDKAGAVFLCQNKKLEDLGQKAKRLAVGRNPNGLDTLFVLDDKGTIVRYDRETKTWTKPIDKAHFTFSDLVVRPNDKGDGQVLFGVSGENLFKIVGDSVEKLSSSLPKTYAVSPDGKTVARYRFGSVPFKPYIDVLCTPSGKNILRDAPADHLHHHGLMFALQVGGCSFWGEFNANHGKQLTLGCSAAANGFQSAIDWNAPGSITLLKENRRIDVNQGKDITLIDWQCTLTAQVDTVLGGEGSGHYYGLGLRFDETMDKDGRFFNDTGKNDGENVRGDERLTPCRWMAYTAKLNGEPVTVALFDHPSNPIPMTAFTMGDSGQSFAYLGATMNLHRKPFEMKAGQTLVARYRIAVWDGEVSPETIEKATNHDELR